MADAETIVTIETASRQYVRTDPVFLEHVVELRDDLVRAGIEVVSGDGRGQKGFGDVEPIVQAVVLGGPGLLALCGVVKLWLKQRGGRLLRMTVEVRDGKHVVELDGKNVSDETLLAFSKDVAKRLE
ncbi:effector-associated constant component EACC1 [Amycolatopsis magusensis]|uniref:Uncharacterized protein n=1 Tax=Amycolatopsis magusensis TaxID=882444 RepID=A0ABS4PHN8_9PSEU|nr:hypothetical protein [Amycolatopsis magusensis]MBP2178905.1 hypothetical protein [Amycolatopsis magusensis]